MTTALDSSFFEFWIWTNHNSLLSIATNQFASFCINIRSRQCYFRVFQSGEIWNKKAFFPCILIFLLYEQIDSMLPCICPVIDHRGHQNVVRTSVTHSAVPRVPLFCSYHVLTSSVIYYWTDARQHGIYLLIVKPLMQCMKYFVYYFLDINVVCLQTSDDFCSLLSGNHAFAMFALLWSNHCFKHVFTF